MAQMLKDKNRNKIIEETIKIVYKEGSEKVSMRDIANKCNMTVGNLYRYFDNKQSLMTIIYQPFMNSLDCLIKEYTNEAISIKNKNFRELKFEHIDYILDKLCLDLVRMHNQKGLEMKICLRNTKVNSILRDWFSSLLLSLAIQWDSKDISKVYCDTLSSAIFEGINFLFDQDLDDNVLNMELNRFLKGFIGLLKK